MRCAPAPQAAFRVHPDERAFWERSDEIERFGKASSFTHDHHAVKESPGVKFCRKLNLSQRLRRRNLGLDDPLPA